MTITAAASERTTASAASVVSDVFVEKAHPIMRPEQLRALETDVFFSQFGVNTEANPLLKALLGAREKPAPVSGHPFSGLLLLQAPIF